MYNESYFNDKWRTVMKCLPTGGAYHFNLRQYGYDITKNIIADGSKIFDYACGLGLIDIQLEKEKNCKVYGCDISEVAVNYVNSKLKYKTHFKIGSDFFGSDYDYILAIYFLEHIKKPWEWVEQAFKFGKKVICIVPNNFRRSGEHKDMAWKNWTEFYRMFDQFNPVRIDGNKYPKSLSHAFKHPIILFNGK